MRIAIVLMLSFAMHISSSSLTCLLGQELKFGNPSPKFTANLMQGAPFASFPNGKTCIVEFSGTACGPCIKLIPEMNALQKHYPELVFVSVFCEDAEAVKKFMNGLGKAMEVRVAVDESGQMKREWLDAAKLQAIPQVFIVDSSGTVAWFGYPDEQSLGETIEKIVLGTFDSRMEQVRLELTKSAEAEDRKLLEWTEKTNDVLKSAYACKTTGESLAVIDKALPEFTGSPQRITLLSQKLTFLGALPGGREQSYQHALALAVDAINERNPNHYVGACEAMLSHVEFARPENRDGRLADLALIVLHDKKAPTNHVSLRNDEATDFQIRRLVAIGNSHRLRGEWSPAVENLENAIERMRQRSMKNRPAWWIDQQRETLSRLEEKLRLWREHR